MSYAPLYVVLAVVFGGAIAYVHRRGAEILALTGRGRRRLAIGLGSAFASIVTLRALRELIPPSLLGPLGLAASTLALALLVSAALLAVSDAALHLVRRAARGVSSSAPAGGPAPPGPADPSRRTFLANAAAGSAFLVGGTSSLYGALRGRHDYVIEEVVVAIPGLSRALDGFTIVQLSDLHLGAFVGEAEMAAAEDLVRKAAGDLIVLTGDLVDFDPGYGAHAARLVRRIGPLARNGVVAVPGNHDHYAGAAAVMGAIRSAGADVLVNRGRTVGDPGAAFALLGVDDVWAAEHVAGGGPDLPRALAAVAPELPRVLLCHNPVFFHSACEEVALQLSGHTHGGQINALLHPADWVLPHGYVAGTYQRGRAKLYVNRGFGTAGPPLRLGAAPEVTRVVLVSA